MKIEEYETKTTIIVYLNKQKIITVLRRKLSKIQIGRQKHLKQVYTGSSNPIQWSQETGSSGNLCDSWPAKRLHLLCSVLFSHVPVFFRIVKKCNLFKWMIYWQIKALSAETRHCMTKPILPGNPAQDLGISVTFSEPRNTSGKVLEDVRLSATLRAGQWPLSHGHANTKSNLKLSRSGGGGVFFKF